MTCNLTSKKKTASPMKMKIGSQLRRAVHIRTTNQANRTHRMVLLAFDAADDRYGACPSGKPRASSRRTGFDSRACNVDRRIDGNRVILHRD